MDAERERKSEAAYAYGRLWPKAQEENAPGRRSAKPGRELPLVEP